MGLKNKRPLTPGQRFQIGDDYSDITKTKPEKSLLSRVKKTGGRDARGRVSMRCRGGGNKQMYRLIDFKRTKDLPATVLSIEYDPNRNARIALIEYSDGQKSYILAPIGFNVGEKFANGPEADISVGSSLPIKNIPIGTVIHNVELIPGAGGKLARAAGGGVMLSAKEKGYGMIKLPSGELRMVNENCRATVGQVGNLDAKNVRMGKAGKNRHRGRRPKVRGTAMNPCDHPHGGGEGKAPVGRKQPLSPWGKPTLGKKTRRPRRRSDRFIISRRKK